MPGFEEGLCARDSQFLMFGTDRSCRQQTDLKLFRDDDPDAVTFTLKRSGRTVRTLNAGKVLCSVKKSVSQPHLCILIDDSPCRYDAEVELLSVLV